MKYMVSETFRPGAKDAVYERFNRDGRMLPAGLEYLDSWLSTDGTKCFQLMESEDETLFDHWTEKWNDLIEFEIIPVESSPTKRAICS